MLPPLTEQKVISAILYSVDQCISLNKKINHHLEQIAQTIFKSWFVDFEPWGGKMPEGWKIGSLTDVAEYINGLAMQKHRPLENERGVPVLKIKELRQGMCDSNSDLCSSFVNSEYIIQDGDVVFSWSGSLMIDFWCGGTCGLNQHLFKVKSTKYSKWFYYFWTYHHLEKFIGIASDKATTMGHIKREDLDNSEVLIPNFDHYKHIDGILNPIVEQMINNRIECRKMCLLRDTLLPKLMSGELSVSDIDEVK
jgi:type I restriction enzyme S subunit